MIVISDTSVLSGLIKIEQLELLKDIFSEIIIPPAVQSELDALKRFNVGLSAFEHASWVIIKEPADSSKVGKFELKLDRGEVGKYSVSLQ